MSTSEDNLAPVIIFVYNRPWHTEQTLKALKSNDLADQSTVYIFADGPKKDATQKEIERIVEVRTLLHQEKWCKEVIIAESNFNKGLAQSVIEGVTHLINQFGKVIVVEDDLITAKGFLKFMNEGLNIYENHPNIFGLSGFCFPNTGNLPLTYKLPVISSWSWASWKRSWDLLRIDTDNLIEEVKPFKGDFDFGNYGYYQILEEQGTGEVDSWDIQFYASMFLKGGYFIFPKRTLVQNIGFDTGTHFKGGENFFSKVKIESSYVKHISADVLLKDEKSTTIIKNSFRKQFSSSILKRFRIV